MECPSFCFPDFERLLFSFPTDDRQSILSVVFSTSTKYEFIYETQNFFLDFHAIPFPRKGERLFGMDSAREITIYNDTIFSISHRGLLFFEEEWIDERFTINLNNIP